MRVPLLLDTCAIIWLMNGEALEPTARDEIRRAVADDAVVISPISGWEIATLASKRRLTLNRHVEDWFATAMRLLAASLAELTPAVLIRSVSLPGDPPSDPSDRTLISTARQNAFRLVTRDKKILAYAKAGHVAALAC